MPNSLSFLDLPPKARKEIYTYVGLLRLCPIDLGSVGRSEIVVPSRWESSWRWTRDGRWCESQYRLCWLHDALEPRWEGGINQFDHPLNCCCPRLPTGLLLVSRAVHADAMSFFISRNKFLVRAHAGPDLALLENINDKVLSGMTSLLVRLNCWPCPRGHNDGISGVECHACWSKKTEADPVLDSSSPEGRDLIQRWTMICKRMTLVLPPGQLRLTFVCDVDTIETARQVIYPLRNLPTLAQCTIRLGRESNYTLRALAQDTSFEMTKKALPQPGTFPFERLPRELRYQILSLTDLAFGEYHKDCEILHIVDCKLSSRRVWDSSKMCCWKCTDTLADCCCSKIFAAYSASCVCRMLPLELFFVNKQMCEDAFQVFYSKNCFQFESDPEENALAFLKGLPKEALPLIRRLRFVFDEPDLIDWKKKNYSKKWHGLISFIRNNFNVPNLSIEIDTGIGANDYLLMLEDEDLQESSRKVYVIYCDIGRSLHMLPDLHDLYFDNGWFVDLGPLLAKDIIGEEKFKPRKESEGLNKLSRQWDVPVWWYQWPTTSPNPPASLRPLPIPAPPPRRPQPSRGRGRG